MQDLAVVNFAPAKHSVELREIPRATIGDDEVLLEVQAVGVCGSDLHMWTGQQSWPMKYPVVLGHEFCGVIREVGTRVVGWQEGDRVVSETAAVIDPNSPLTRQGLYNLDPNRRGYGAMVDGAMRRYRAGAGADSASHAGGHDVRAGGAHRAVLRGVQRGGEQRPHSAGRSRRRARAGPIGILCGADRAAVRRERGRRRDWRTIARGSTSRGSTAASRSSAMRREWARQGDGLGVDGVVDATGVSGVADDGARARAARPAGSAKSAGARSRSASRSIRSCRRTSRCKAASATTGRSGSA